MTEELTEFLQRKGWSEDIANDIHVAYYDGDMNGVIRYAETLEDDEHDYVNEIVDDIRSWQKEVGEMGD